MNKYKHRCVRHIKMPDKKLYPVLFFGSISLRLVLRTGMISVQQFLEQRDIILFQAKDVQKGI